MGARLAPIMSTRRHTPLHSNTAIQTFKFQNSIIRNGCVCMHASSQNSIYIRSLKGMLTLYEVLVRARSVGAADVSETVDEILGGIYADGTRTQPDGQSLAMVYFGGMGDLDAREGPLSDILESLGRDGDPQLRSSLWDAFSAAKAGSDAGHSIGLQIQSAMKYADTAPCATALSLFMTSAICEGEQIYTLPGGGHDINPSIYARVFAMVWGLTNTSSDKDAMSRISYGGSRVPFAKPVTGGLGDWRFDDWVRMAESAISTVILPAIASAAEVAISPVTLTRGYFLGRWARKRAKLDALVQYQVCYQRLREITDSIRLSPEIEEEHIDQLSSAYDDFNSIREKLGSEDQSEYEQGMGEVHILLATKMRDAALEARRQAQSAEVMAGTEIDDTDNIDKIDDIDNIDKIGDIGEIENLIQKSVGVLEETVDNPTAAQDARIDDDENIGDPSADFVNNATPHSGAHTGAHSGAHTGAHTGAHAGVRSDTPDWGNVTTRIDTRRQDPSESQFMTLAMLQRAYMKVRNLDLNNRLGVPKHLRFAGSVIPTNLVKQWEAWMKKVYPTVLADPEQVKAFVNVSDKTSGQAERTNAGLVRKPARPGILRPSIKPRSNDNHVGFSGKDDVRSIPKNSNKAWAMRKANYPMDAGGRSPRSRGGNTGAASTGIAACICTTLVLSALAM